MSKLAPIERRHWLDDFREYVIGLGLVENDTGWTCTIAYMPEASERTTVTDQCVTLGERPGGQPSTRFGLEDRVLHVRVRSGPDDYIGGSDKARQIFNALHGLGPERIGTTTVRWITAQQAAPLPWPMDGSQRWTFSWSFTVAVSRD